MSLSESWPRTAIRWWVGPSIQIRKVWDPVSALARSKDDAVRPSDGSSGSPSRAVSTIVPESTSVCAVAIAAKSAWGVRGGSPGCPAPLATPGSIAIPDVATSAPVGTAHCHLTLLAQATKPLCARLPEAAFTNTIRVQTVALGRFLAGNLDLRGT